MHREATAQRQKSMAEADKWGDNIFAAMKLPDHAAVAARASRLPVSAVRAAGEPGKTNLTAVRQQRTKPRFSRERMPVSPVLGSL